MTHWTTKVQFPCFWTDFNNFFSFELENFMGIRNPILYFTLIDSLDHSSPISQFPCLCTDLNILFSLTWKFDGDSNSDIVLYLKCITRQKSPISCLWTYLNYFFFFDLEIRWGFQIRYCTLPQITHWTTKV